jgi:hypothetical protein
MELGTQKIEKIVDAITHVVVAGKKITADKKVDLNDLPAAMELLTKVPEIVEAFKDVGDAGQEAKDVNVDEVIQLITLVNAKVKLIEQA